MAGGLGARPAVGSSTHSQHEQWHGDPAAAASRFAINNHRLIAEVMAPNGGGGDPADELAAAQQQGRNLREYGYGAVSWEDLLGRR